MTGKRLKRVSLLALLVFTGLAMLAWTQTWATLDLRTQELEAVIDSSGGDGATAVMGFSLAALAAVGALAIAGRLMRTIIAVLTVVLGAGIAVSAGVAMGDPAGGFASTVRQYLGIVDEAGVRDIIAQGSLSTTAWPAVALVAGIGLALSALAIVVTAHRWPQTGRKYSATRFVAEDGSQQIPESDRISQWDALSAGDDPTVDDNGDVNPR